MNESQEQKLNKYLEDCDWDSAAILDEADKPTPKVLWQRALALCFRDSKDHRDGKFDDAVEAATKAVAIVGDSKIEARCVRAYAYYLNGNYEQALAECKRISAGSKRTFPRQECFVVELCGLVYDKLEDTMKAQETYSTALGQCFNPLTTPSGANPLPSPLLMNAYRESVKRLNRK